MEDVNSLDDCLGDRDQDSRYRRIELITGRRQRRTWTPAEKARIVAESAEPDANISAVARRHGVNRALLSVWRRQAGLLETLETAHFVPVETATRAMPRGQTAEPGTVEVDLRAGRVRFSGAVDPGLAQAILATLRGVR